MSYIQEILQEILKGIPAPPPCIRHPFQSLYKTPFSESALSPPPKGVLYDPFCALCYDFVTIVAHKGSNQTPFIILYKKPLLQIVTQARCLMHGEGAGNVMLFDVPQTVERVVLTYKQLCYKFWALWTISYQPPRNMDRTLHFAFVWSCLYGLALF